MKRPFILVFLLVLSLAVNFFLFFDYISDFGVSTKVKMLDEKYPLLDSGTVHEAQVDTLINFLNLRSSLHKIVDPYGNSFALYFEYLPTGISVGINSNNEYQVASLFKLPLVMAYFRHKENNKITSDKKVKITQDEIDSRFGDLWQKGPGYEITLDSAAKIAMVDSDNTAAMLLGPYVDDQDFKDVYDSIDIQLKISSEGAILSPKNYSSILKALYFSAVLTKDDSERILGYLTESKFNDKLVAGLPPNIKVAHKIGVIYDPIADQTYLDCGIIYIPRRPYLLCLVSKSDETTARDRMSAISKTVYDFVVKR